MLVNSRIKQEIKDIRRQEFFLIYIKSNYVFTSPISFLFYKQYVRERQYVGGSIHCINIFYNNPFYCSFSIQHFKDDLKQSKEQTNELENKNLPV